MIDDDLLQNIIYKYLKKYFKNIYYKITYILSEMPDLNQRHFDTNKSKLNLLHSNALPTELISVISYNDVLFK